MVGKQATDPVEQTAVLSEHAQNLCQVCLNAGKALRRLALRFCEAPQRCRFTLNACRLNFVEGRRTFSEALEAPLDEASLHHAPPLGYSPLRPVQFLVVPYRLSPG